MGGLSYKKLVYLPSQSQHQTVPSRNFHQNAGPAQPNYESQVENCEWAKTTGHIYWHDTFLFGIQYLSRTLPKNTQN